RPQSERPDAMPAFQIWLNHGVAGEAVLGSSFCAAHGDAGQSVPAAAQPAEDTGLTQEMAMLSADSAHEDDADGEAIDVDGVGDALPAAAADPAAQAAPSAAPPPHGLPLPSIPIRDLLFREWADHEITVHFDLVQLACAIGDADPRLCLGLARFAGPVPSEQLIAARLRTAPALCDLTLATPLSEAARSLIYQIAGEFRRAAQTCETEFLGVLAQRRKLKPVKLPMWKELGATARSLLRSPASPGCQEVLLAQSSCLLADGGDSVDFMGISRWVSELLEKGDEKASEQRADGGALPALVHGTKDVSGFTDLWPHPLLGPKWIPAVRSQALCTQPLEMILPGRSQPRHVQMVLAIFGISLDAPRQVPRMLEALSPLFAVAPSVIGLIDMPADYLPQFLALLAVPLLRGLEVRQRRRSLSSLADAHRICLDVAFPAACAELDATIILNRIRRSLSNTVYFALNTIYDNREALVLSLAASDTWVGMIDRVLKHDPDVSASRIRWRPSAHGGTDHMADIVVQGELGTQDSRVIAMPMDHATSQLGIALQESTEPQGLRPGEYFSFQSRDIHGQP
ncbi:unnamed protein product, partial [Prorocentrum cordatum]